jgi:Na+/melibiose symporter-like transporter
MIMAVPTAVRIVAPVFGGYLIDWYVVYSGLTADQALVRAVRICWSIALLTGFLVAWLRLRYLKETVTDVEASDKFSFSQIPKMVIPAYKSIFESIKWMNKSLRVIVIIEMFASFFIAMSAPFYVVYAKEVIGLIESQWGLIMFISGFLGILVAFPMGSAVDKIGPRKMILLGMFLAPIIIWSYQYMGGFLGVALILCGIVLCNNIMMHAFSTIIANSILRSRRGRLYSLLGERGVTISFGNFWGGGFLLFPPAALGAYVGGHVYTLNPNYPWMITAAALIISAIMTTLWIHEPKEAQE